MCDKDLDEVQRYRKVEGPKKGLIFEKGLVSSFLLLLGEEERHNNNISCVLLEVRL
jgi:hypothetical protein